MTQTAVPGPSAQPDAAPAETDGPAPSGALDSPERAETRHGKAGFWTLLVGSVGVVYGDIGTSPLYAFREALGPARADSILLPEEVLGTVSLILWALFLIVTVKYV
ncbi:KUP/HAK/KT family potassium transporter, partial [Escherichia coli]